ncbi:hypothetical protein G7Y79_00036g072210 [Physcia stellaris]|nr:hypothetical protein G7Y79_00036g072210 [Physcia stellaris]
MHFSQLLLIGASFVASTTAIAFTTLPASVQAGVPTELKWDGNDPSEPVTITLKQGPPDNLITVAVITGKATGKSFTWTPSKSLPNANNYALMISQGVDDINYTGEFSLTGGSAAVPTSSSSLSLTSSSLASQITPAILSSSIASLNASVSALVASVSNATGVATTTVPAGTAIIGTIGRGGSLSAATGTVMNRNTTMSSATLTRSKTASTTASTTSTESASTTAATPAATTSSSSDAMGLASPLAFVLFAAGAIVYLG